MVRLGFVKKSFFAMIAIFAVAAASHAQDSGSLHGTITDPNGAVIGKANVQITERSTGAVRNAETDTNGSFGFTQVKPGNYTVVITHDGFRKYQRDNVTVLVASPTTVDVQLVLGDIKETITVEAGAMPTLNTLDATVGNPFDEKEVKGLPFAARNPVNLLTLQPGVTVTGQSDTDKTFLGSPLRLDEKDGVVNGVRSNQSNITLDGVDANNWETQAAFTSAIPLTLDSLQEFRVTTTNANATDGDAGGAQVALVTKSGTNNYHGNARWLYRTSGTSANDFFNAQTGLPATKLVRNIGGASFGGPVKKNRLFFFLDYELRREASGEQVSQPVPSDDLKQGILKYVSTTGQTVTLNPSDILNLDPAHIGVNPAMLAYLSLFPTGNDVSQSSDGGLTNSAFRFNAPVAQDNNIYTARVDYNLTASGSQSIFFRGSLGDIKADLIPAQFPGLAPSSTLLNNSRGFVVAYNAQIKPTVINSFRYGLTRVGIDQSGAKGAGFSLRNLNSTAPFQFDNFNRAVARQIPTHELKDDLSWIHGKHTFQMGGSVRFTRSHRLNDSLTFPFFQVNTGTCVNLCRDAFNTLNNDGNPNNDPSDPDTFNQSFLYLLGSVTQANATFFVDPKNNTFLPAGSAPKRVFAENGYEGYFQDSWKVKSNVTLTLGVRYSYDTPVWEANGNMVSPTADIQTWWNQRLRDMAAGVPSDASPDLSFALSGRANGKDAWWQPDRNNFAPRLAVAWSPNFNNGLLHALFGGAGKTSIRAGAGIYYSRMGGAIAADTDVNGSFGLADSLVNGAGQFTMKTAPRFSGSCDSTTCSGFPDLSLFFDAPTSATFPAVPVGNFKNLGFLVDNRLRTPYSTNVNFGVQRELGKGFVFDVGYVGTFGRKLTIKTDLSQMYGNFKDPASGQTLWGAYNQIVDLIGKDPFNPQTPVSAVPNIAFFDNLLPNLPGFLGVPGDTPTQAFYELASAFAPDWGDALAFGIDTVAGGGAGSPWNTTVDPQQDGFVLYQRQYQSLPAWVNWGSSTYHSLQLGLRKNSRNVTFGANYVYSKSIDNGSAPENADLFSQSGLFALNGQIANPLDPRGSRSRSDFDLRHNFNAYWLTTLPFGHGQHFLTNASRALQAAVGDWQFAGSLRARSGFPITPGNGFNFPTNFELTPPGTLLGAIHTHVTRTDKNGFPNLFGSDPDAVAALLDFTRPGGSGTRNGLNGPGYFSADMTVTKGFRLPWSENQKLIFSAAAYNVFNNVNFSELFVQGLQPQPDSTFGRFNGTTNSLRGGNNRDMEFGLRFEF
jgi:hypothetical protein